MSDTPIADKSRLAATGMSNVSAMTELYLCAQKLERELAKANKDITRYQYLFITNANPTGFVLSNELRNRIDKAMEENEYF
jgi:hypothetical protein